jgi:hypothetical protein
MQNELSQVTVYSSHKMMMRFSKDSTFHKFIIVFRPQNLYFAKYAHLDTPLYLELEMGHS